MVYRFGIFLTEDLRDCKNILRDKYDIPRAFCLWIAGKVAKSDWCNGVFIRKFQKGMPFIYSLYRISLVGVQLVIITRVGISICSLPLKRNLIIPSDIFAM